MTERIKEEMPKSIGGQNKNSISTRDGIATILSSTAVLALVLIPTYLLIKSPELYNVPVQIMFSIFLTISSTWLGISINNRRARREATAKWLPAAEVACKDLLMLSATAERMRRSQARVCDSLDPLKPEAPCSFHTPLKSVIDLQCRESAEKLAILRAGIENSVSLWDSFIVNNCDGNECEYIHRRLKECRDRLAVELTDSGNEYSACDMRKKTESEAS